MMPNSSLILSNVIYKTTIYPNVIINSLTLSLSRERERRGKGGNLYVFEKKGRAKNLPIGVVRLGHGGGGDLILQMEPWLGFRRGAGGWCAATNE
jgi:hypothetical protein